MKEDVLREQKLVTGAMKLAFACASVGGVCADDPASCTRTAPLRRSQPTHQELTNKRGSRDTGESTLLRICR
jgi:hypothetical protein